RPEKVGAAYLHRNPSILSRVRLMGRPVYVDGEDQAGEALRSFGAEIRERVIVEDPDRPLSPDRVASGRAEVVSEVPGRVEVATESGSDDYLVLADTFDPGWSATIDGRPVAIRPAFAAFRAVFVPRGSHRVVFRYRPAGFRAGLAVTGIGAVIALILLAW